MSRRTIDYSSYKSTSGTDRRGNPIPVTFYCFYPDGVWDEDKLTKAEAEAKYPKSAFNWRRIKD